MQQSFGVLRRAAVVLIAVLSFVGAMFLIWSLGTPEGIRELSNAQLAGMVALFLLPGVALAAWELDRRASARRGAEQELDDEDGVHLHDAAEVREPEVGHRHRARNAERVAR